MGLNQELIKQFTDHLKAGKPIERRKRKPINETTARKYETILTKISEWLGKDFNKVTEADITQFRAKLKKDIIRSDDGTPFAPSTKRDYEYKALGMFFKWLKKPELIYYTDEYKEQKEIPALTKTEIDRMIQHSKLRDKVFLSILFDAGVRIGEFLNITFADVKDDERQSKGYYKVRVRVSKTKARTIGLYSEITTEVLDAWLKENPDKIGTSEPLISLSYTHLRNNLAKIGKDVLQKKVYPHLMRHSSATHYCHKLNRYQLCKRYGWSMNSGMPALYIDREGVDDETVADKIKEEQAGNYRKEVNVMKEKLRLAEDRIKTMEEFQKIKAEIITKSIEENQILSKKLVKQTIKEMIKKGQIKF